MIYYDGKHIYTTLIFVTIDNYDLRV